MIHYDIAPLRVFPIDKRDEGQSMITPLTRSGGGLYIGNFLDLDPYTH